ncbi:MAG: hypothetical protein GXX96_36525 [Planctomycetaceae bacterium]|nr:hypothetical protein [Planctomycetaceae bacterium]
MFARNLTGIVQRSWLSRRKFAEQHGLKYKTLCRWLTKGVTNPDKRTREKLMTLCQTLGERFDDLWSERTTTMADMLAERVREIFTIGEQAGIPYENFVTGWWVAARVAQRLRQEEPEMCQRVCRIRRLATEADLHILLENVVRRWLKSEWLSETDAFNRLREWVLGPLDK